MKDSKKSIGGKARAASLSKEKRQEIAKKAAKARWDNAPPSVEYDGLLPLGDIEIACYVLSDGTRVLSSREMQRALRMVDEVDEGEAAPAGTRLKRYLNQKSLKPIIYKDKKEDHYEPLVCYKGKTKINGFKADVLIDLCDSFLQARNQINLSARQKIIADQCEILVRSFAKVGLIALIDEATGYQDIRDRQALQIILDKHLTDEWAKWTKTFPDDFYKELFRLKKIDYPRITGAKPSYVGHWTNDIIYDRIAPGIKQELKAKNPRNTAGGNRKRKHHQYFTKDYGHPELKELLSNTIFMMKACSDWEQFKLLLDKSRPKYGRTIEMDL